MTTRQPRAALRAFLKMARERVQPEEYDLRRQSRRRTTGLRREEVADLAGVSTAWYTLLERGSER
jgi:predicted transcriptional regulator